MKTLEHACRSADVIGVRMREHERRKRSAATPYVRENHAASRVAPVPGWTRIEENPVIARSSEKYCVALADIQHVQLHAVVVSARKGGEDRDGCERRRACDNRPE